MGPRIAGFLVGGFATATASAILLRYDVLRKQEVTMRKTEEMALQAGVIVHRFRVVETGLRSLPTDAAGQPHAA